MQRRLTAVDHLLMFMPSTSMWQEVALTWWVALGCTDNTSFLPCCAGRRTALMWGMGTDTSMKHLLVSSSLFFHRWKGMATDKIRLFLSREVGVNFSLHFYVTLHWKRRRCFLQHAQIQQGVTKRTTWEQGHWDIVADEMPKITNVDLHVVMQRTHLWRKLAAF